MRFGTAVAFGIVLLSFAGPAASAGPELYVIGGVSIANLGGDADQFGTLSAAGLGDQIGGLWTASKKSRSVFDFGMGVSFPFTDVVGGAVEVRYAPRGAKWEFTEITGSGFEVTGTMKLTYVELPLLLQVKPPVSGSIRPVFLLGPVLGLKTASDFEAEALGQSESVELDGMNSTYLTGIIGAGIQVDATPRSSFLLQVRFQPGSTNLVDDSSVSITSSAFSILAGWSFGL